MEAKSLRESLESYEAQLEQVNTTLAATPPDDPSHETLLILQKDISSLIDMVRESLDVVLASDKGTKQQNKETVDNSKQQENHDIIDDEYAKFMAEMADTGAFSKEDGVEESGGNTNNGDEKNEPGETIEDVDIEEELSSLQGMKCSVLYSHRWGGAATLHNAMVCSVETSSTSYTDIQVKVLFTNPTHVEMVPCPFYLDGDCKFSDEQCRFSHGEVVSLSTLSEATEPDFSLLKSGCRVLAKVTQPDEPSNSREQDKYLIWHRAVVREVDSAGFKCVVKLEHSSSSHDVHTVPYANIFPLTDDTEEDTDTESSHDEGDIDIDTTEMERPGTSQAESHSVEWGVQAALRQNHGSVQLGEWEKYTKGIGSKLMMSMGWVSGSGLGVKAEGRLHPVQCQITPLGKSLDHVMEMKEGKDPGKMQKRLRRIQKRREDRMKKEYERQQDAERRNVFNVLNDALLVSAGIVSTNKSHKGKSNMMADVKNKSTKGLNVEQFQLSEDETRLSRDIEKLKTSLNRNSSSTGSAIYKSISAQLNEKYRELESIKVRKNFIMNEQSNRKSSNKLTIF